MIIAWAALNKIINRYLQSDPRSSQLLKPLIGKAIRIIIDGINIKFTIIFDEHEIILNALDDGPVDATIQGLPFTLLRQACQRHATALLEGVVITGDATLVQAMQILFKTLDIDWEGLLARATGDMIAHRVSQAFKSIREWLSNTNNNMRENVSEYLHEEIQCLVPAVLLQEFYRDVDELRDTVDRLEARLRLLIVNSF